MFSVVHFNLDDIKPLLEQPINSHMKWWADGNYKYVRHLAQNCLSLTVLVEDKPMLCAFFLEVWTGRGYMASVFSEEIKARPVSVYRGIKKFITTLPYNRIEFDSPCGFDLSDRRAKFLGFNLMSACAKKYLPNGDDASIYEWVRP